MSVRRIRDASPQVPCLQLLCSMRLLRLGRLPYGGSIRRLQMVVRGDEGGARRLRLCAPLLQKLLLLLLRGIGCADRRRLRRV